jgi:3-oxoacyl-[acyl-carrier protein] reductase
MDLGLKNKVVLVTGGSRGLGRAICQGLAAEGAHVAVNYLRTRPGPWLADMRSQAGIRAMAVRGDISKAAQVRRMFERIEAELGPLDVLINNAGYWPKSLVKDMSETEWDQNLAVNLTGPFLTCREAVRLWLRDHRPGRIVNITSLTAYYGTTTGHAHYACAKAGLANFTISLAREMAPHGILVNSVSPGFMVTDMTTEAIKEHRDQYLSRIPLRRFADPAEVVPAVLFLASGGASYITGCSLHVNGGLLMH